MAEQTQPEEENLLGQIQSISGKVSVAETKNNAQLLHMSHVRRGWAEEPVAGNPHDGFREGR